MPVNRPPIRKGRGTLPEPLLQRRRARLLELGRNAGELGVQLGAKTVDDRDDRDRDVRRDEAVLDGGRTRFVLHETHEEVFHLGAAKIHAWLSELARETGLPPGSSEPCRTVSARSCVRVNTIKEK